MTIFLAEYFGPIRGASLDSLDFSGDISPMLLIHLDFIRPLSSPIFSGNWPHLFWGMPLNRQAVDIHPGYGCFQK